MLFAKNNIFRHLTRHRLINTKTVRKSISFLVSSLILFSYANITIAETTVQNYYGDTNAITTLKNIDFLDIRGTGTWAAEAIYQTGALSIMKGNGNLSFGENDALTREQALALALRIGGREADALTEAEKIDTARSAADKVKEPNLYWSYGYIKIAADEGMIPAKEYTDMISSKGTSGFDGKRAATRQEMAFWMAKAMKLTPVYEANVIMNFYDWKKIDGEKVPYLEIILQNKIMNGDGNGYFNPNGVLTRGQAAQIAKNAEKQSLSIKKYIKNYGTVEDLVPVIKVKDGIKYYQVEFNVRNIDGSLANIVAEVESLDSTPQRNEQYGQRLKNTKDLVVYKDSNIGGVGLLTQDDRIEYIVDGQGVVKFVKVVSSTTDTRYTIVQVKDINTLNRTIEFYNFLNIDTSVVEIAQKYAKFSKDDAVRETLSYSTDAIFVVNNRNVLPSDLKADSYAVFTIVNDVIKKAESYEPINGYMQTGIIHGMVQDNNPSLGYITLYSEEGKGVGADSLNNEFLRTFDYSISNEIDVYKDHNKASMQDIIPGDSVFIKLDEDGRVKAVSAISNYTIRYATLLSRTGTSLNVQYNDSSKQILRYDSDTRWKLSGEKNSPEYLKDGDSLLLVLQVSPSGTKVIEVRSSDSINNVGNVYKAKIEKIDKDNGSILISDTKKLYKNKWERVPELGLFNVTLAGDCSVYLDGKAKDITSLSNAGIGNYVYIATTKGLGGTERAVNVSINTANSLEMPVYNDIIYSIDKLTPKVTLKNAQINIPIRPDTIIVKSGKIVNLNSLKENDSFYIATAAGTGSVGSYAAAINVEDKIEANFFEVYRGGISNIDDGKNFSVRSYKSFSNNRWSELINTEKSFAITGNTRLLSDKGVTSLREFIYGSEYCLSKGSPQNKNVYVVSKNGEAILISTAPFSNAYTFKGEIYNTSSKSGDQQGIALKDCRSYNPYTFEWNLSKDQVVTLLPNTVIIKGDRVIKQSELAKGDKITLVKMGNDVGGNVYIIFVEE